MQFLRWTRLYFLLKALGCFLNEVNGKRVELYVHIPSDGKELIGCGLNQPGTRLRQLECSLSQ